MKLISILPNNKCSIPSSDIEVIFSVEEWNETKSNYTHCKINEVQNKDIKSYVKTKNNVVYPSTFSVSVLLKRVNNNAD